MRFSSLLGFGAVLTCAAFLVACGGGGHSGGLAGGVPSGAQQSVNNSGPGTHVTVYIHNSSAKSHPHAAKRLAKTARRNPKYLSTNHANGLQISVAATGATTQTVYVDISNGSPLCTPTNTGDHVRACTFTIPTVGATEQISALETDAAPTNPNGSGYGTGFANGTHILAAINQTQSVTLGGSNSFGLELGPVVGYFWDCTNSEDQPTSLPQAYSANFGLDTNPASAPTIGSRIVVTGGTTATGSIAVEFGDWDCNWFDGDTTPAPFVDVNGSPTPITVVSNNAALAVAPIINNGTAPPVSAYAQTGSIPNDGYYWLDCEFFIGVKATSSFASPTTLTVNNNLTALSPFTNSAQPLTLTYTVVPITVSPTTATVTAAGGTAIVTGTDSNASDPMDAESAFQAGDESCNTGGGTTLATVSPGSLNTTNWTQPFTITGANAGTGTCTFYIYDTDAGTVTLPVTVTVN